MTAVRPRLRVFVALAGAGAMVVVWLIRGSAVPSTRADPSAKPPQSASVGHAPEGTNPTRPALVAATRANAAATPPVLDDVLAPGAPTEILIGGVDSADPIIVAESVNALVARAIVSALPGLVMQDVLGRPKAALSIIYGMGRLAAVADPEGRDAAVDRLLSLMSEEKRRGAPESPGNLLQIYEALGDTGEARAIAPLEREVLDATVPTAPKVVIVHALVALHAKGARGTLEQLAAQLAMSTETGLEGELRRELLTVIKQALVQLS
jgi:hypothetical protein